MFTRKVRGTIGQELTRTFAVWLTQVGMLAGVWGFASFLAVLAPKREAAPLAPLIATFSPGFAAVLMLSGPLVFLAGYFMKARVSK